MISRESLRRWLIEAQLWRVRRARVERPHVWRARRARYGELVQWDTSEHDWLEGRGEKVYLISMIDDVTSRLSARFIRHDSTEENLQQQRRYVEEHGRPVSVYTDKASLFQTAPRASRWLHWRNRRLVLEHCECNPHKRVESPTKLSAPPLKSGEERPDSGFWKGAGTGGNPTSVFAIGRSGKP